MENNDVLPSLSFGQICERLGIDPIQQFGEDFLMFDQAMSEGIPFRFPCRIDALIVMLCTGGRIRGKVNLKEFEVTEGMVIINMPMNIVQVDSVEDSSLRGFIFSTRFMKGIHVDIKNFVPLYMRIRNESCIRLQPEDLSLLNRYYTLIREVLARGGGHAAESTNGLIASMVYLFCDMLSDGVPRQVQVESAKSRRQMFFEQFMALLDQYHCTERSLKFYADRLYITPKYLSSVIKEVSGRSAADWVDAFVVLEAKTLLKFSDLSIQEIAYRLNFSTQSFFGKYFKHQTGISPSEYKMRGEKLPRAETKEGAAASEKLPGR